MKKPKLEHIPSSPGVYQMIDKDETILYIGMSVNLKNRVRSYFADTAKLNFAKKKMVQQVDHVHFTETHSEIEALILETNLIKQHKPKYNILMKDDKNLSYIKITNDPIPMVIRTRKKGKTGTYFGPYSQYIQLAGTLHELRKLFVLGNHPKMPKKWSSPCMDYYIGLCPGHCTGDPEKIEAYKKNVDTFEQFMRWKTKDVFEKIEKNMYASAQKQEFEQAQKYKNQLEQLRLMQEKQVVRDSIHGDVDVVILLEKYEKYFIGRLEIRNGSIVGTHHTIIKNPGGDTAKKILEHYIVNIYASSSFSGSLILGERKVQDSIRAFLESKKIYIQEPKAGVKLSFVEFCKNDILNFALSTHLNSLSTKDATKKDAWSLMKILFPNDVFDEKETCSFECYDISHHQWEHTVASKSVIINGKRDTSKYKRYRIKTLKTGMIDDFASMHEVLSRRTRSHCEGVDVFPTMIVIDGGKGQLSSSVRAIETIYGAYNNSETPILEIVRICSLAKREEEVFVPGKSEPILLKKWSPELMMLQRARDEAHRFAINFNRSKREKQYTKTILDEIPGIGDKTRKKLLQAFGSVNGIEQAPISEVKKIVTKKQWGQMVQYGIVVDK